MGQNQKADTVPKSLKIVNVKLNFNEPDGGFYSEYLYDELNSIQTSVIVKNNNQVSSTCAIIESHLVEYDNKLIQASDTALCIQNNFIDTIDLVIPIDLPWRANKVITTLKVKQGDSVIVCDSDTIVFQLYYGDWVYISRSSQSTSLFVNTLMDSLHSGDFVGIKLKFYNYLPMLYEMRLTTDDEWAVSASLVAKVYEENNLVCAQPMNFSYREAYAYLEDCSLDLKLHTNYYFGFEIQSEFNEFPELPFAIDTSGHHSFEHESIARINGEWTTLDFVPVMSLLFNPEGVEEKDLHADFDMFPNPVIEELNLSNVGESTIEIYSVAGKKLYSNYSIHDEHIVDLSCLISGNYIVKVIKKSSTSYSKLIICK